jgi:hypothetical protein
VRLHTRQVVCENGFLSDQEVVIIAALPRNSELSVEY